MPESVLVKRVATKKNGVFAIVAVAPWGGSGGGTLPPPELARRTGVGMVPSAPIPPSLRRRASLCPHPLTRPAFSCGVELLPWALVLCEIGLRRAAERA